jgi:chromosomal replication initiator protein
MKPQTLPTYLTIPGLKYKAALNRTDSKDPGVIVAAVCEVMDISVEAMMACGRKREMVLARQMAIKLIFKYAGFTKTAIGKFFGKDHTSIIHHLRVIEDILETETEARKTFQLIELKLID